MGNIDYDLLDKMKKHDFFAETEKDFYQKMNTESVLAQGKHWDNPPLVTIIIPTYKRPKLLEQALNSALQQEGFDDYQILIVDNEGIDISCQTETASVVAKYQDEKIIYYRHKKQAANKMDTAVNLAKSEWICFLHDDDLLVKNHLISMYEIIKNNPQISYLSCTSKSFTDEIDEEQFVNLTKDVSGVYQVKSVPRSYSCTGFVPGWLGAFIKRKNYIAMGGMPAISTGIGDYIMQGKYMAKWDIHFINSADGLYCYRQWTGQITSSGTEMWTNLYCVEYYYLLFLAKKFHKFSLVFWKRICAYMILDKCKKKNKDYYKLEISITEIMRICEMPQNIDKRNIIYLLNTKLFTLYKVVCEQLWKNKKIEGQF